MPHADSDGVKIWWDEQGTGEPILLVMGFGNSSVLWGEVAERLAAHHRVIVLDNRGTGRSDEPAGAYTVPQMAADAVAVLDAAGVRQAVVQGVSLGGVIAQEMALSYPERVNGLVLACTTCPAHMVGGSQVGLSMLLLGNMLPKPLAKRVVRRYSYDRTTTKSQLSKIVPLKAAAAASPRTLWRQARAGRHETCSRLAEISTPTLVIQGSNDRLIPVASGRKLATMIPGARFVEVPHTGHMFFLEDVDSYVGAVEQHLTSLGESGLDRTAAPAGPQSG
jgi:pimeloyl-ACP methyl ester carboxylesterase